ncbi:phospho-sugar mutase [Gulosibacter sp. GYB002]|uniref:phospho-sugar mutase n=1 Tax=Gulosibacter sp. GYB002 TaxID=2994391 RepID=UPI002F96168F
MIPLHRVSQTAIRAAAQRWLEQDPDPDTRAELRQLLDAAGSIEPHGITIAEDDDTPHAQAWRELRDRFSTRLSFGTAGLRGRQAAGPNRMNRVTVGQAARGFADFLLARAERDGTGTPTVVIGYDARVNSDVYAHDTAELMQAAGVNATLLPRMMPTPVLAFAVRHLNASAGVMVTASHNPKWDNGYKVYLGGDDHGSQIVPPSDGEIAAAIERVANHQLVNELPRDAGYQIADESVIDAYVAETAKVLRGRFDAEQLANFKVVYTPLHGVGWDTYRRVLAACGIPEPAVVAEQIEPDGSFPTVDFPNPEEPGALDLAYAKADEVGANLVIAHDPDADRLAVALQDVHGQWQRLGGNDIGKFLGWRAAEAAKAAGTGGTLATSLVSSPAMSRVAQAYDLDYVETQTGFKWISRTDGIIFGYEEALGYLVDPNKVRDKDGISAAVAMLDLAIWLAGEGRTLHSLDDEFAERFGAFSSRQVSVRFDEPNQLGATMSRLREQPPTEIDGVPVAEFFDFETAAEPANILRIRLADDTRIMVRPSGTEPKIKSYIDAASSEGSVAQRRASAEQRADAAAAAMRAVLLG